MVLTTCIKWPDDFEPPDYIKVGELHNGGWVFYDKGYYENGWRYLMAAPGDLDSDWGLFGEGCYGTENGIGKGQANTNILTTKLSQIGENNRAAQRCADYTGGGYTDWFLPSKDELNQMFQNLKLEDKGDFGQTMSEPRCYYWSSSVGDTPQESWRQDFRIDNNLYDNQQSTPNRIDNCSVRPVRRF